MSAKEDLRKYVATLSEGEAAALWDRIQSEHGRQLSDRELQAIRRGLDDVLHGRTYPLEDVERELGLV